jgi:signal transduction histidine kinase
MYRDRANKYVKFDADKDLSKSMEGMFKPEKNNENKLIISVVDQGKGLSDKELKAVRKTLYADEDLHATKGFGLMVIKEVVKAFDGEIHVDSKEGKGAKFTFSFMLEIVEQ